jgi:hypothetical protein
MHISSKKNEPKLTHHRQAIFLDTECFVRTANLQLKLSRYLRCEVLRWVDAPLEPMGLLAHMMALRLGQRTVLYLLSTQTVND